MLVIGDEFFFQKFFLIVNMHWSCGPVEDRNVSIEAGGIRGNWQENLRKIIQERAAKGRRICCGDGLITGCENGRLTILRAAGNRRS